MEHSCLWSKSLRLHYDCYEFTTREVGTDCACDSGYSFLPESRLSTWQPRPGLPRPLVEPTRAFLPSTKPTTTARPPRSPANSAPEAHLLASCVALDPRNPWETGNCRGRVRRRRRLSRRNGVSVRPCPNTPHGFQTWRPRRRLRHSGVRRRRLEQQEKTRIARIAPPCSLPITTTPLEVRSVRRRRLCIRIPTQEPRV